MDDRLMELVHGQIDGANTSDESAELEALLDGDREAQVLFDDLTTVAGMLNGIEAREPPARLRQAILEALPKGRPADPPRGERFDPLKALFGAMRARPGFAFAYTFSFGLVVGLVGFSIFANTSQPLPADPSALQGALVAQNVTPDLPVVDEASVDVAGVAGTVRVREGQDLVVVELALDASGTVEARLTFDREGFSLRAYSRTSDGPGPRLATEAGSLRLTTSGGNTHIFVLNDHASATSLELVLLADDEVLFQRTLETRGPGPP
jgi:hypothetical protein